MIAYTRREQRAFLAVLFLIGTSNYVDRNVLSVLLEQIKQEFHASDTMLGLLSGLSFALLYATLGIPVARWADRGDRRQVIFWALAIWSAMTMLCGAAGTFWQLMVARFGVGAGEAGAIPPAQSLIADYFSPAQRSRAIGIFLMSSAAGYALGLIVGGFVAERYGWRSAFLCFGLTGFALLPLVRFVLREPRRTAALAALSPAHESTWRAACLLLAKPSYRGLLGTLVVYYFVAYGALIFVVPFLIRAYGLRVADAGTLFGAVFAIGAVIGSVGGGVIADRLVARDVRWLARVSGACMIVAAPVFVIGFALHDIMVLTGLLLLGAILLNAAVPPVFSALHLVCGGSRRAVAVALVYFFANLIGLGGGPVLTGALSDAFAAASGAADGLRFAMMFVMTALLLAGGLMLQAGRHFSRDAED